MRTILCQDPVEDQEEEALAAVAAEADLEVADPAEEASAADITTDTITIIITAPDFTDGAGVDLITATEAADALADFSVCLCSL